MKKKQEKYTDTFNAKVDIVTEPDNIKYYSNERNDYTELAMVAIQNKAKVIKLISPSYKDYPILCEEAVRQKASTFLLIDDNVSNYRELGIRTIITNPSIVICLNKETKYYLFFWKLAIFTCYKVLMEIDEDKEELFPLVEEAIKQEPLAIFFVNSSISIYNKLCNIAYNKNNESTKYMDINFVDKKLVSEIIAKEPEKIKYLDINKDYYKEACKIALKMDGKLIKYVYFPIFEKDIDFFFELINIAEKNATEIADYTIVLHALCVENRQRKNSLINTPNVLGNNLYKLLTEIDKEYELLSEKYFESLSSELSNLKYKQDDFIIDCPIKVKTINY